MYTGFRMEMVQKKPALINDSSLSHNKSISINQNPLRFMLNHLAHFQVTNDLLV